MATCLLIGMLAGCATDPAVLEMQRVEGAALTSRVWHQAASRYTYPDHQFDSDSTCRFLPDGSGIISSQRTGYTTPGKTLGEAVGCGSYTEVITWPVAWTAEGQGNYSLEGTDGSSSTGPDFSNRQPLPLISAQMSGNTLVVNYQNGEKSIYRAMGASDSRLHPGSTEGQRPMAPVGPPSSSEITSLIENGHLVVRTAGRDIQTVSVQVRKKTPGSLRVKVPVGTFFVSANPSSQNMVATGSAERTLTDDAWHTLSISAACANRPRAIPGGGDSFQVQRSPSGFELAQIMPVLARAGADYKARQAAVWIATDDASYEDLGSLNSTVNGVRQGRVIREVDAARAMKIYHDAGLTLTRKAIWRDRARILAALPAGELKRWLQNMK